MTDPHPSRDEHGNQTEDWTDLPPVTGDAGVDRVLQEVQEQLQGGPDEQVAAVTEAHRQLQARLATPTPPGQARPGPR